MDTQRLRALVASFYNVAEPDLDVGFVLNTPERQGSVARYALDALLRRELGVRSRAVHTAKTYGELEAALTGAATPPPVAPSPLSLELDGGVTCGVDIELVANLPESNDYFADDFCRAHFTNAEIAYAVAQTNPRMHLAARWCAKEALKKCDPAFVAVAMNNIEVTVDEAGRPRLRQVNGGSSRDLPYAVSITHTPDLAAAIAVAVAAKGPQAPPPVAALVPAPSNSTNRAPLVLAILACLLAVLALVL